MPFLAEVRSRILELLAPRPGQIVLDVGCGSGQDVFEMARLVGRDGLVLGVDRSETLIEEARQRAARAGITNIEFRVGEAETLPLDADSVDAACSDRVFQYLADPARAVRELARVTRPGGAVVVADTDWGASVFDCEDLELQGRVDDAWTTTRASGRIGRQLFGLFVRAGLEEVQVFPHNVAVTDISRGSGLELYRDRVLTASAAQAVEAGAVSPEEASNWLALQNTAASGGRFFRFLAMFVVEGRIPFHPA